MKKKSLNFLPVLLTASLLISLENNSLAATERVIIKNLEDDLALRETAQFNPLLVKWHKRWGVEAVEPLLKIASDKSYKEADRYIAILGAARLGGREIAPSLIPYLEDKSWMIRSATLMSLKILDNQQTAPSVLKLLKDPALTVRVEAIAAIKQLRPQGSIGALVEAILDKTNYHKGKAQWVPQKALKVLVALNAPISVIQTLRPILNNTEDTKLIRLAVWAFDEISGRVTPKPLSQKIKIWKRRLDTNDLAS